MAEERIKPYGEWKSPITTDLMVSKFRGFGEIHPDGGNIYWIESRPSEKGRNVIVRATTDGDIEDVIPQDFNARTRVHEYGGGSFLVHDGIVYFSNFTDQRVYCIGVEGEPEALTPESDLRYADGVFDGNRNRIIYVREDHREEGEPENTIVSMDIKNGGEGAVLISGNDFYSSPRISPDGRFIAWLTWNHPNMPWDGTELWCGEFNEQGEINEKKLIAGGKNESIFQPEWSPEGNLYFISDRNEWWNIYRYKDESIEHVSKKRAEFGIPQWVFGLSTYNFKSEGEIICSYKKEGRWYLARVDVDSEKLSQIDLPYSFISSLRVNKGKALFEAGSADKVSSIVSLDLSTEELEIIRSSGDLSIDSGYISVPEPITFPSENENKSYGLYYSPANKDFKGPEDELPLLIVISHGGPTSSISAELRMGIQFWTSRGFAVLDVNYGGSTGYGREYRDRLKGEWGIVDVDDCINGAKYLVHEGKVDRERTIIRGGSAGGYTTLSALTFRDFFSAGASYYGVSDLKALTEETHKFESRYLDGLIGPYPERKDIYYERSPINHTEKLSSPVIFFQGMEDKVVPPDQAEKMVEALKKKGIQVAYVQFEKEQHGFRRAENIKRAYESELYFYSKIFGFNPADELEPVKIENL